MKNHLIRLTTVLLAVVFIALPVLSGCDNGGAGAETSATVPSPETTAGSPESTAAPETTATPETTAAQYSEPPKSLKVLAVGNSFSTDAMQFLWDIAKAQGVETVVLGNLYIGGCSIDTHWANASANAAAYTYYKNTAGVFSGSSGKTMLSGIVDEEWDVITVQQTSKTCGIASSYSRLDELVQYIRTNMKNKDCRVLFHQTWAYQQDSTHASFPSYDRDQMKMYNMICNVVENTVKKTAGIDGIIPGGTAVQNARTGFVGDRLTRDGYHMHMILGRYLLGLTWFAAITGADVSDCTYNPNEKVITAEVMLLCKESAKNAVLTPGAVTQSAYTEQPATAYDLTITTVDSTPDTTVYTMEEMYEQDAAAVKKELGIDLAGYTALTWDYIENSYYYCTKGMGLTTPAASASTYHQNICTKIFEKSELPEGTIIICDAGYQYRPEKWTAKDVKAASRPGIVSMPVDVMDAAWWGANNFCAFNLSSNPKSDISDYYLAASRHVRFYIPKT